MFYNCFIVFYDCFIIVILITLILINISLRGGVESKLIPGTAHYLRCIIAAYNFLSYTVNIVLYYILFSFLH
jgi:hypothetical protein